MRWRHALPAARHPVRLPSARENVDLRHGPVTPGSSTPSSMERVGERTRASDATGSASDEVERRGLQRGAGDYVAILDEPEAVLGVDARMVVQRACDSEDEVVSGLVLEQKRSGRLEEVPDRRAA